MAKIAKFPRALTGPSFHVLDAAERFGREFVLVVLVSARFTPSSKTLRSREICGGGGFEAGTGGVTEVRRGRREVMACARSEAAGR